jgi:hypothetical protein
MKKKIISMSILMSVIFVTFAVSRCSIIGLGVGIISDASKPDSTAIMADQKINIKLGTTLRILLNDNRSFNGKYIETRRLSQKEYAEYYSAKQKTLTGHDDLPSTGEPIQCHFQQQPHREYKGVFQGFGKDSLEIQRSGLSRTTVIPFNNLKGITDSSGRFIETEHIMDLIGSGQIPVFSAVIIENEGNKTQVPVNEISEIKWKTKKDMKWKGLFGGLGMDIVMLAIFISSWDLDMNLNLEF